MTLIWNGWLYLDAWRRLWIRWGQISSILSMCPCVQTKCLYYLGENPSRLWSVQTVLQVCSVAWLVRTLVQSPLHTRHVKCCDCCHSPTLYEWLSWPLINGHNSLNTNDHETELVTWSVVLILLSMQILRKPPVTWTWISHRDEWRNFLGFPYLADWACIFSIFLKIFQT